LSASAVTVGPLNDIVDVAGLAVGHAHDATVATGVSVVLPEARANAAVSVAGGAPGTRETDALAAENLVDGIDAAVLSGGSSYGLDAASGVANWLGARGRGFRLGASALVSPVVPAAILFDLMNGGDKAWGEEPPYRRLGREAVNAARTARSPLGTVGAGYGAVAGALKGGLGAASAVLGNGATVGALAAVNSFGSVLIPGTDCFWAWPFEQDNEFGGARPPAGASAGNNPLAGTKRASPRNTTLAVVATDVALTPAQLKRVAQMAQDGIARSIRPAHGPTDGDTVFAISTGRRPPSSPDFLAVTLVGALAADCLARAIARGVYEAAPLPGIASYRGTYPNR